ncbi:MAG: hypothetical protein K2K63_10270 [Acetatifactor sp.]|nr:hypothetical protein [Acetatifactor sp.]
MKICCSIESGQEDHDRNEAGACSPPRFCYEIRIRRKPDIRQSQSDYRMLPGEGENAVQACLQTHSFCEWPIRRKPDSEMKRSGIELSPDEVGVRRELAHRLVFVMRFVSGESRTSGNRKAITGCCPVRARTVGTYRPGRNCIGLNARENE